jgi:hypothetical protein
MYKQDDNSVLITILNFFGARNPFFKYNVQHTSLYKILVSICWKHFITFCYNVWWCNDAIMLYSPLLEKYFVKKHY